MRLASILCLAPAALAVSACGRSDGAPPAADPRAAGLLSQLPAPYRAADLANGKLHFSLCRSCHTVVQGAPDTVGPNLFGVFGRKVGSKPGYAYSDALKTAGFNWDAPHLDRWLDGPQAYLPGTKMAFPGVKDSKDRTDLIAYLKVASSGGPD